MNEAMGGTAASSSMKRTLSSGFLANDARLTHAVECNSTAGGNSREAPPHLLPQA
jgi:hypothetical protein